VVRTRSRRPKTVSCRRCKTKIKVKSKGPLPLYCSQVCKQRAYERRKHSGLMVALAQDLATVKVRDVIRAEVRSVFQEAGLYEVVSRLHQAGLIEAVPPLLRPSPPKNRPSHLRIIHDNSPDRDNSADHDNSPDKSC